MESEAPEAEVPTTKCAIEFIQQTQEARGWSWGTVRTVIGRAMGALLRVEALSRQPWPHGRIILAESSEWKDAMRYVDRQVRDRLNTNKIAAALADVAAIIANERIVPWHRLMVLLAWITSGRLANIETLQRKDIRLESVENANGAAVGTLTVFFRQHKTATSRGPYTIVAELPTAWTAFFNETIAQWRPTPNGRLFRAGAARNMTAAIARLKTYTGINSRGIRRGSLRRMAESSRGIPLETLLLFSGHTRIQALYTYLDYQPGVDRKAAAAAASRALHPEVMEESDGTDEMEAGSSSSNNTEPEYRRSGRRKEGRRSASSSGSEPSRSSSSTCSSPSASNSSTSLSEADGEDVAPPTPPAPASPPVGRPQRAAAVRAKQKLTRQRR